MNGSQVSEVPLELIPLTDTIMTIAWLLPFIFIFWFIWNIIPDIKPSRSYDYTHTNSLYDSEEETDNDDEEDKVFECGECYEEYDTEQEARECCADVLEDYDESEEVEPKEVIVKDDKINKEELNNLEDKTFDDGEDRIVW